MRIRIIKNLSLDGLQTSKLRKLARTRFQQHASGGRVDFALHYLALLFCVAPSVAVDEMGAWLSSVSGEQLVTRVEQTFGFLFDRGDPLVSGLQRRASIRTLECLLRLVYHYVRPEHDAVHQGSFSPDGRDHAESARNVILEGDGGLVRT
jgi:hypothetical protein